MAKTRTANVRRVKSTRTDFRRVKATKAKGKNKILLGATADDIAGATDLCDTLVGQGMRTVQEIGVPGKDVVARDADAIVIALNTRTGPAKTAIRQLLAALRWLQARGAKQIFFKYRPNNVCLTRHSGHYCQRCAPQRFQRHKELFSPRPRARRFPLRRRAPPYFRPYPTWCPD